MMYLQQLKLFLREPRLVALLMLLPLAALLLSCIPAYSFASEFSSDYFAESFLAEAIYNADSLQTVQLSLAPGNPFVSMWSTDDEECLEDIDWLGDWESEGDDSDDSDYDDSDSDDSDHHYGDYDVRYIDEGCYGAEPHMVLPEGYLIAPGFVGFSSGFTLDIPQEVSLLGSVIAIPWAVLGALFLMGTIRIFYAGEFSFRQFKKVFRLSNAALAFAMISLLWLVSERLRGPEDFIIPLLLGIPFFLLLCFRAVGNDFISSLQLVKARLTDIKAYLEVLAMYLIVLVISAPFSLLYGPASEASEFGPLVLASVLLIVALVIQAVAGCRILMLSGNDPKTEGIMKDAEGRSRYGIAVAKKRLAELRAANASRAETILALRSLRLSVEEIEGLTGEKIGSERK